METEISYRLGDTVIPLSVLRTASIWRSWCRWRKVCSDIPARIEVFLDAGIVTYTSCEVAMVTAERQSAYISLEMLSDIHYLVP